MKPVLVLISANAEWRSVRERFAGADFQTGPYGEWFEEELAGRRVVFVHGGWGKIAAAASAEHAILRWQPELVINLGTCGGFAGKVERGEILLADETIVYDIVEQMGDADEALAQYTTHLDLGWLPQPFPLAVRRERLVSADRDIVPQDIPMLVQRFGAVASDWESGAIAWVAARHGLRCLILRGVSDLVDADSGGEAYGKIELFHQATGRIMGCLLDALPELVELI